MLGFPKHKLTMDCKTRWNSTYEMIKRYIEPRVPIMAAPTDERIKGKETRGLTADLSDSEASNLSEYVKTMAKMSKVTKALSSENNPTVGLILPLMKLLQNDFDDHKDDSAFVKKTQRRRAE